MSRKIAITGMGAREFVAPVLVHVEHEDIHGRYWAYWQDAEASGYGATEVAALADLKENAARRYDELWKAEELSREDDRCLSAFEDAIVGEGVPV